jgi:hypothetical protein
MARAYAGRLTVATQYKIYSNNLAGGPVDYATPIGTTASLTFATAAVPHGSDATFAVRAYDTVSGLEERNTDRRVRVVTDAAGIDITARPNAPSGLHARPGVGGTAEVAWSYNPLNQGGAPTGFKVWVQAGVTINYATAPSATVAYAASARAYAVTVAGLSDGVAYAVAVRAYNALAADPNTVIVPVVGKASGPAAPDDAAAAFSETP